MTKFSQYHWSMTKFTQEKLNDENRSIERNFLRKIKHNRFTENS